MTRKVIKETKYCEILNQGKLADEEYTYSIEKIFIKAMKRDEIRFSLYKDTIISTTIFSSIKPTRKCLEYDEKVSY